LFILFTVQIVEGQPVPQRKAEFNIARSGLAIEGYDPVAYFILQKPVRGNSKIALVYEGLTYYFSSEKHKEMFRADPVKYEPQYGGWCAYAMGNSGEKVEIDPETFKVVDGKLFLFYNKYFNNTLKTWNKDETNLLRKANANWSKILKSGI